MHDIYIYAGCGCRTLADGLAQCLDAIVNGYPCSLPTVRETRVSQPCSRHPSYEQQSRRGRSQSPSRHDESTSIYGQQSIRNRSQSRPREDEPSGFRARQASRSRQPSISGSGFGSFQAYHHAEPARGHSQTHSRQPDFNVPGGFVGSFNTFPVAPTRTPTSDDRRDSGTRNNTTRYGGRRNDRQHNDRPGTTMLHYRPDPSNSTRGRFERELVYRHHDPDPATGSGTGANRRSPRLDENEDVKSGRRR
jgi:hypothetical protein